MAFQRGQNYLNGTNGAYARNDFSPMMFMPITFFCKTPMTFCENGVGMSRTLFVCMRH